ncbi:MAG TPA: peptidoglycan editing factor PgeF [Paludibacteraceae bacterium]|nr:peptidoglycan editing factor PgeF [Paludibacteraceae bacterium]HOU68050.1 peptidoglycan editing factor PgeF [Paludibacteraceae bacterium]HPH62279.1 peptidoglycan editing factor PgeF [Paludibacteraceae bacterium]HQJ89441.1 peptidoglycan editing factor PgeF [Paludibacteraceae bacterium]
MEYSSLLSKKCGVTHFFSTIEGGVGTGTYATFSLGAYCGDDPQTVAANRKILCDGLGIAPDHLIVPHEVHSNDSCCIDESFFEKTEEGRLAYLDACDALVTTLPGVCVAVTTADCVPVLLCDADQRVVMAVHAGWKGVFNGIVPKFIKEMVLKYGSSLSSICAVTGPCISGPFYEVSQDLVDKFATVFPENEMKAIVHKSGSSVYLDLRKAVEFQFQNAGIAPENYEIHPGCTYSQPDRYFSARRQGFYSGRLLTGIMLK